MAIQKVFAIYAEPAAIWNALWAELSQGDQSLFRIQRSHWPNALAIEVSLAGLPAIITYEMSKKEDLTEVSATLQPLSARYTFLQILTLGRMRTNYELMLAQALSNLKTAVEADPSPTLPVPALE